MTVILPILLFARINEEFMPQHHSTEVTHLRPTTLCNHPHDGSVENCLTQALISIDPDTEELVFLSPARGHYHHGHVVLHHKTQHLVREPHLAQGQQPLAEYLRDEARQVMAVASVQEVELLLQLPAEQRWSVLQQNASALRSIARLPFCGKTSSVDDTDGSQYVEEDKNVHKWLDALGDAISNDDKNALAQTADDAKTLQNFFQDHKRGSAELNENVPTKVADAQERLLANDEVASHIKDDKGLITRDKLKSFLSDMDNAAKDAKSSFEAFSKKANKADGESDPVLRQQAVNASILQANMPLLDTAGDTSAKADKQLGQGDLKGVADSGLSDPLKNAARLFANDGQFHFLNESGLSANEQGSGKVDKDNLKGYVTQQGDRMASGEEALDSLRSSAMYNLVQQQGGDASRVNADYFTSGESDAKAEDKVAALLQFSETLGRMKQGIDQFSRKSPGDLDNPDEYHNYFDGDTPGEQRQAFSDQINDRIKTLANDSDVRKFLNDKLPGAMNSVVSSDPAIKSTLESRYKEASGAQALNDAFAQHDNTTDAITQFLDKSNAYAQALDIKETDYSSAFKDASDEVRERIQDGYQYITSGQQYSDLKSDKYGKSETEALIQSVGDKALYDQVLDKDSVSTGSDRFNEVTEKLGRDDLLNGVNADDLIKGLGVDGLDDDKLTDLIKDNLNVLSGDSTSNVDDGETAKVILSAVRNIHDSLRSGFKFDDAMSKAMSSLDSESGKVVSNWDKMSETDSKTFKGGVMHGASALLLAGAMGGRLAAGGGSVTQTVQQSLQMGGLLAEGGSKFYSTFVEPALKSQAAAGDSKISQLLEKLPKDVENVGKVLGVTGNVLGFATGIIGAKQAAANGDIGDAAAQGVFAGLNGIASVSGVGEITAYVLSRLPSTLTGISSSASTSLAGLGGVFGAVGGVVGGAAAVGGLIYAIVQDIKADQKLAKQSKEWYGLLEEGFKPSGVELPGLGTMLSAENGTVPINPNDVNVT
ncbi:hypothetical protein GBV82_06410 [Klebsiella pneumoniae]|nr:hypothetical protein GBV82_06410 [Klebsiella pneumoniae]